MDVSTEIEAPTIQSCIPDKDGITSKPSPEDTMDIDVVTSIDALTDHHKQMIHHLVGSLLEEKPFGTVVDVSEGLKKQGLRLSGDLLATYLQWIAEHYEAMPHLHLPQILYDPESHEFYDVS